MSTRVCAIFPRLPVLDAMEDRVHSADGYSWGEVAVVGIQHLLETTGSLIECLIRLGIRPAHIFLTGKCYSSNDNVVAGLKRIGCWAKSGSYPSQHGFFSDTIEADAREMWERAVAFLRERRVRVILVLDDGGYCLRGLPSQARKRFLVAGVEQTTSGVHRKDISGAFPIVNVAQSATKQMIESPMIGRIIIKKLGEFGLLGDRKITYGVVGHGRVGRAVYDELNAINRSVLVFDRANAIADGLPGSCVCTGLQELVAKADVVLGCTGEDLFAGVDWIDGIQGVHTFVSCSTADTEFRSLLKMAGRTLSAQSQCFGDVELIVRGGLLRVLHGGFPVNFDNSRESVPSGDIQVTRGLLLGGLLQAFLCAGEQRDSGRRWEQLDVSLQRFVIEAWKLVGRQNSLTSSGPHILCSSHELLRESSRGAVASYPVLDRLFAISSERT